MANETPPSTPGTPAVDSGSGLQWTRELVAAGVGLLIVVVSMWMLISTFSDAGKPVASNASAEAQAATVDAYNREKDILLLGLGLVGTVLGYYLGRAPAELRANTAAAAASEAQSELSKATSTSVAAVEGHQQAVQREAELKSTTRATLDRIAARMQPPTPAGTLSQGGVAPRAMTPEETADIQREIDELRQRIS